MKTTLGIMCSGIGDAVLSVEWVDSDHEVTWVSEGIDE